VFIVAYFFQFDIFLRKGIVAFYRGDKMKKKRWLTFSFKGTLKILLANILLMLFIWELESGILPKWTFPLQTQIYCWRKRVLILKPHWEFIGMSAMDNVSAQIKLVHSNL
jgi:hypothetical protein